MLDINQDPMVDILLESGYHYPLLGKPKVTDGDTLKLRIITMEQTFKSVDTPEVETNWIQRDCGWKTYFITTEKRNILVYNKSCRFNLVDAPEKSGFSREAGLLVTEVVRKWVESQDTFSVISTDKGVYYNRFIGEIFGNNKDESLSNWLLRNKLVKAAPDKKRQHWTQQEIDDVSQRATDILSVLSSSD